MTTSWFLLDLKKSSIKFITESNVYVYTIHKAIKNVIIRNNNNNNS